MPGAPLQLTTLTPGAQSAEAVAGSLADWLHPTRRTLDLALYNVRVPGSAGGRLHATVRDAAARGVAVRILVHRPGVPVLPLHAAPTPRTRLDLLRALGAQVRTVEDDRRLMHHKFAIRDEEAVWTGSANWTLDDFAEEENVVMQVRSPPLALAFTEVFEQLWETGTVEDTGALDAPAATVGAALVRPWFCPGRGRALSARIAERIAAARTRVRVASPVITAGPVLRALADVEQAGTIDATGIVDATLTGQVLGQWRAAGVTWKVPLLEDMLEGLDFAGKASTPGGGSNGIPVDYMHAKVVVADDAVFAGSFNLSRSGEENAENMLEIEDPALATRLTAWIDALRERHDGALGG
jgi:phosphatidylserine/phosphatidylglycerophosphate/cardiolipin synthase-like enzyme